MRLKHAFRGLNQSFSGNFDKIGFWDKFDLKNHVSEANGQNCVKLCKLAGTLLLFGILW